MVHDDDDFLPRSLFDAWAAHLGLDTDPEHLDQVYPEARGLLQRLERLHEVDASSVEPGEAYRTLPIGMLEEQL